jgi:DNA-binding beta-propeller fold protein YncE
MHRFSPFACTPPLRVIPLLLLATACAPRVAAQSTMAPVNSLPNPYRIIEGWAKMPPGRTWGSTSAVDIDRDGKSVWVAERCGTNSCVGSTLDPVLKFDPDGNLVTEFGSGMILSPHGIAVDGDGNIWVVDCTCTNTGRRGSTPASAASGPPRGHQIFKFSPTGKLLMTLGKPGGGRGDEYFTEPNAILIAPDGFIYVSEGHSSRAPTATSPGSTARIFKFSKDGTLIKQWGQWGKGPDDFDQPHALAMDSRGRLFVGDRGNNRIKIFDRNLNLVDTWYQFSRPSGIVIDAQDNMYVGDSESGSVNPAHGAWQRGIRIGSAKDGSVKYFIPDTTSNATNTSSAEGIAVDKDGVIYGAEVGQKDLKRYVKP